MTPEEAAVFDRDLLNRQIETLERGNARLREMLAERTKANELLSARLDELRMACRPAQATRIYPRVSGGLFVPPDAPATTTGSGQAADPPA